MKIKVQGSVLSNILKNISRIAPPLNNALTLKVEKNKFSLIAINEVARCFYSVPTESIEGEGSVCVSIEALKSAIAGRKELTLYEQEGVLKIVSGNFKINLATQEIISYEFEEEENVKTQSWQVTTEQASWLKQAVTNVALTPTAIMENPPLVVKLSNKNAFVCCYSSDHLAFALTKEITGNLELSIPCETFMNVLEVFSKQNFTLSKSDTKLTVSNELCEVSVSLPSQEYLPSQIIIDKEECEMDADEIMMLALDAGAEDFSEEEDSYEILTAPDDFSAVREALEKAGLPIAEAQVAMIPQTYVELTDEQALKDLQRTLDLLDDDDDVTDYWTNWDEQ